MTILCLGEALVDLVCEREIDSIEGADCFRPHFGGALANVSVAAARAGARVELAGGVGDDEWGRWLRGRLEREGVGTGWMAEVPSVHTPVVFITFDRRREPSFEVYGETIGPTMQAADGILEQALDGASALVCGSNTLAAEPEREVTLRAADLARRRGVPIVFDPNIRPRRWREPSEAIAVCREMAGLASLLRTNEPEGRAIAGTSPDAGAPETAIALCELGPRVAVVSRGAAGAVCRGASDGEERGVRARVASPLGAGDAFVGALVAELDRHGLDLGRTSEALAPAVAAGARACEQWSAIG